MQRRKLGIIVAIVGGLTGCASTGSSGGASSAEPAEEEPEPWAAIAPEQDTASAETSPKTESESEPSSDQPNFTPGMSVAEASNAVPDTIERLNIEQEALAAPLMEPDLYEPCSLQGHHHFELKVAVWDGRAVGVDVSTQPNDEKLEACLRQQISGVEWQDKAKSINTVEYKY